MLMEGLSSPPSLILPQGRRLKSIFEPQFYTLLSLSELALQKEKSPKRVSVSIEGQKAKKHPTTAECFFLFVESEGNEPFRQTA